MEWPCFPSWATMAEDDLDQLLAESELLEVTLRDGDASSTSTAAAGTRPRPSSAPSLVEAFVAARSLAATRVEAALPRVEYCQTCGDDAVVDSPDRGATWHRPLCQWCHAVGMLGAVGRQFGPQSPLRPPLLLTLQGLTAMALEAFAPSTAPRPRRAASPHSSGEDSRASTVLFAVDEEPPWQAAREFPAADEEDLTDSELALAVMTLPPLVQAPYLGGAGSSTDPAR